LNVAEKSVPFSQIKLIGIAAIRLKENPSLFSEGDIVYVLL